MSSTRPASKVVVLGARGMLGTDLVQVLREDHEVIPLGREDGDITDGPALRVAVAEIRPAWVLNSAAYTDVDGAESRKDQAYAVNRDGAVNAAAAAAGAGARLVHFSTDFVFDGTKDSPYLEDDPPNPLGVYGRSKWEGEQAVLNALPRAIVIRTSWTFGAGRTNFVDKVLARASERAELKVVSDQRGSPTYTADLAAKVRALIAADPPGGVYHVTNTGACTRSEEAEAILRLGGVDGVRVVPVPSSEFPTPAARPANSVLENGALKAAGLSALRPWREALAEYMASRRAQRGRR